MRPRHNLPVSSFRVHSREWKLISVIGGYLRFQERVVLPEAARTVADRLEHECD
jgi:hypothetical protein